MNWLDIIIGIVLVIFLFLGLKNGLIRAGLMLIGLTIGVTLAGRYYDSLADKLPIVDTSIAKIVAYFIILVIILLAAFVLAFLLRWVIRRLYLGWADRLGGAVLGLVIGAAICGAILTLLLKFPFFEVETIIAQSRLATVLVDWFPRRVEVISTPF